MNIVDRFWIVEPNYSNKPEITLGFKYSFMDVDNPNKIKQPTLQAIRFNSNGLTWKDWAPSSNANADNMLVTTGSIPKQYFYTNWTLASEDVAGDIWIPNAFTPDRDENYTNEDFGPLITFQYARYEFYIYDRWGELVFQSEDIHNRWDGTYMNSVVKGDIFTWLIIITKESGKKYKYTGTVNVIL
jgi:gliding motility-associated-like protein